MVSTLRRTVVRQPVADLGPASPLPILSGANVRVLAVDLDPEMAQNLAYGQPDSLLPYSKQDAYDRLLRPRDLRVAVLENDQLRATFLLDYGGRLWSLVHLASGQELLHHNETLQLANLGLRDAWFAGGVEWNLGATGHTPLTCGPLHAARVTRPDGTPVLRLYEYERMRGLVYQLDAYLPTGSPVLYVHVRVLNPQPHDVPLYWWSNAAVPQTPDVRIIVPADTAFHFGYDARLRRVAFPDSGADRPDSSRPGTARDSADYFFDIATDERPWIAAVDSAGHGLVQVSTAALRGRKLFVWGTAPGGRHWQDWLSGTGHYLEIQAGLARTQFEHLALPANESRSWVEAYGRLAVDPRAANGPWEGAKDAVRGALAELVPSDVLDAQAAATEWVDMPPEEILHRGSGWGALERHAGSLPDLPGTPFGDDTLGTDQQPWLALLATGGLPPSDPPAMAVTGERWLRLLERHQEDWHALLHRGLLRWADGDRDAAVLAWRASAALRPTPWALRNLGEAHRIAGQANEAADLLVAAYHRASPFQQLTIETLAALVAAGRSEEALVLLDGLDDTSRANGRIQLLECAAALEAGQLERAAELLHGPMEVPDLREGEDSLDGLWWAYHDARRAEDDRVPVDGTRMGQAPPLPYRLDFRMGPAQPSH